MTDKDLEARRYRTIVADPPWHYDDYMTMPGAAGTRRVRKPKVLPYGSMNVKEIASLPVGELAEVDCFLFLWTTNRYLPTAFGILGAWGFKYRQTLVWHKTGSPSPFGGTVAPNHAEFLLVGALGTPRTSGRGAGSVIAAPKPYVHSRKPDVFLDFVEQVSPPPRLEMFARRARFGWDYYGDESLGTVELSA